MARSRGEGFNKRLFVMLERHVPIGALIHHEAKNHMEFHGAFSLFISGRFVFTTCHTPEEYTGFAREWNLECNTYLGG